MIRSVRITLLVGIICLCSASYSVHADSVTLTSGSVTTLGSLGTINVIGNDFSLNYSGETPGLPTSFPTNSVTLSFSSPSVTYQAITTSFFRGTVSFNNSLVSGSITGFASMQDLFFNTNPLFVVDFSGTGFVTISDVGGLTQTRFTVSPTAVPEPATLVHLLLGLFSCGGLVARRRYSRAIQAGLSVDEV